MRKPELHSLRIVRRLIVMNVSLGAPAFMGNTAIAQDNEDCLQCHASRGLKVEREGREISLYVDADRFEASTHGGAECIDCHVELDGTEEYPHAKGLERVNCGECHEDDDGPLAAYWASTHGRLAEAGDKDAPLCQDCHGSHYIIPLAEPESAVSPFKIPRMCAQCHAEGAEVERTHDIPQEQIFQRYKQSIHGEGLFKQGLVVTAVCTSCHTGHNVLPHTDPRSTIHKNNIVSTCMQCHGLIEDVHRKIIAGEFWEADGAVPICVECHGPHEARRVFYDTAVSGNVGALQCARYAIGLDQMLFGTDVPFGNQLGRRLIRQAIEAVEGMELSDEDKRKIYQDNAIKLLRLPLGFPLKAS